MFLQQTIIIFNNKWYTTKRGPSWSWSYGSLDLVKSVLRGHIWDKEKVVF